MFAAVCSKVCDTEIINVSESCLFTIGCVIIHYGIYIMLRLLASDTFFRLPKIVLACKACYTSASIHVVAMKLGYM